MKKKIIIIVIFLSLFGPKFHQFVDFSFLIFIPFIFSYKSIDKLYPFIFFSLLYLFLCFLGAAYSQIFDVWHIFQPIKSGVLLLGTYGFFQKLDVKYSFAVKWVLYSIILHSIIVIVFFFFIEMQQAYNQLIGFEGMAFRRNGLTNSYGSTSIIHAFAIPIIYLSNLKQFKKIIFILLVLVSQIMIARVGFYFSLLILFFLFIKNISFKSIVIFSLFIYLFVQFITFISLQESNYVNDSLNLYLFSIRWAFEVFINIFLESDTLSRSLNTFKLDYFNSNFYEFIFGTGKFGRVQSFLATDVSYLLYFSYSGILGIICLLTSHIFLLKNKNLIYVLLILMILITNLKEPVFFTRGIFNLIAILSFFKINKKHEIDKRLDFYEKN